MKVILYGALLALALIGPAVVWNGGCLELETIAFITHYTADRPLLQKVFDPDVNDFGTYQARELSYIVDAADAGVYTVLARDFDRTLFVPFSAFACTLLLGFVFVAGVRRTMDHIDGPTTALICLCFVVSFGFVATMGIFARSSKPALAVIVLAFLFHVRRVQQKRSRASTTAPGSGAIRDRAIAIGLCICAGLLDRQGFFYVTIAVVLLWVHQRLTGQLRDLYIAAGLSAAFLLLYNLALAPILIHALNGYWPDFSYQRIPLGRSSLLANPRPIWLGLQVMVENIGVMLGGFRPVGFVLVAICTALLVRSVLTTARRGGWDAIGRRFLHDSRGRTLTYAVLLFGCQVLMFGLMVQRHPPIYGSADHRYWYYPFPFLVTVLFAVTLGLNAAIPALPAAGRRWLPAALLLIALSNLANLDRYKEIMRNGLWFGREYAQSQLLKASLRSGLPDAGLDVDYRQFFDDQRALRQRAGSSIEGTRP